MKTSSVSQRISRGMILLLCCALGCMGCLAALSMSTMQTILRSQSSHSESFVPAKRLSTGFEREILNARIFFIYFVTIQKPGSLAKGWERYHNAEARIQELSTLVEQQDELRDLRAPVAQLRVDLDDYGPALLATLKMVQAGERTGSPHYDAQVTEWAARGAVLVTDAGKVESLCSATSEASTSSMVRTVRGAEANNLGILAASLLLCVVLTVSMLRSFDTLLRADELELEPIAELPAIVSIDRPQPSHSVTSPR